MPDTGRGDIVLPFKFYLITDRKNCDHDMEENLPKLASAGLKAIQVREKDLKPKELDTFCRHLQASLVHQNGAPRFFMNDRADLAVALGFAGVHLREESMPLNHQAPLLRQAMLWGVSTHNLKEALKAEESGADFITFGPIYETSSKTAYGKPKGLKPLQEVAAELKIPVFALGGITPERVTECLEAGAWGVASVSSIWKAKNPVKALEQFKTALGGL